MPMQTCQFLTSSSKGARQPISEQTVWATLIYNFAANI